MKKRAHINFYKYLRYEIIIVILILILPFIFYTYLFVPESKVWENKLFSFDSGQFDNANYMFWFMNLKIFTLSILTIWYLTCKHFWRFILIVPIHLEIYKLISLFKVSNFGYDVSTSHNYEVFYFSIPYLLILFLISNRLGYFKHNKNYNQKINEKINKSLIKLSSFKAQNYRNVHREMKKLYLEKENMDKRVYLIKLIQLRELLTTYN